MARRRWRGTLTIQGEECSPSDRRIFDLFTWREMPLTLRLQTEDFGGHDGAAPVASIEDAVLNADGRRVRGWGWFSAGEAGEVAAQWVEENVLNGVSVDPGHVEYVEEVLDAEGNAVDQEQIYEAWAMADEAIEAGDEDRYAEIMGWLDSLSWRLRFTAYEIAAATLVATPGFSEARIELWPEGEADEDFDGAAGVEGQGESAATDEPLPFVASTREQARAELAARLAPLIRPASPVAARLAPLLRPRRTLAASAAPPENDPTPVTVARFSPARTIAAGGSTVFRPHDDEPQPVTAAIQAAAGGRLPVLRAAWLRGPEPGTPATRFRITDDGQMAGHLFRWEDCHRGFSGRCQTPPRDRCAADLTEFHTGGPFPTDDGEEVMVGALTYADLHAGEAPGDPAVLRRLMEDTGTQIGPCRLYPDDIGMWCAGQLHADVTPDQVGRVLTGFPSGDWRVVSGRYWLYGLHVVNTPGLPWREERDGQERLVASMPSHMARPQGLGSSCSCGGHGGHSAASSAAALADLAHLDRAMKVMSRPNVHRELMLPVVRARGCSPVP